MSRFHTRRFLISMVYLTIGTVLMSTAYCLFIAPHNIFSGGFTGLAQIIQNILKNNLQVPLAQKYDLTGILLWIVNLPLLFAAYRHLSGHFFFKTLYVVLLSGFIMSTFAQSTPIVVDRLASCLVGGAMSGFGSGMILKSGGTSGGTDIMGLLISKAHSGFSVGKVAIFINLAIYIYLGISINIETAIYSMIYSFACSVVVDKFHYQNIQTAVLIISKCTIIGEHINKDLKRGVTHWPGCGEYTKEESIVYMTIISKYESHKLVTLVKSLDPHAFIIFDDNREVVGNFEKRFDA